MYAHFIPYLSIYGIKLLAAIKSIMVGLSRSNPTGIQTASIKNHHIHQILANMIKGIIFFLEKKCEDMCIILSKTFFDSFCHQLRRDHYHWHTNSRIRIMTNVKKIFYFFADVIWPKNCRLHQRMR